MSKNVLIKYDNKLSLTIYKYKSNDILLTHIKHLHSIVTSLPAHNQDVWKKAIGSL